MGQGSSSDTPVETNESTSTISEEIKVDYETISPRFSVHNIEEIQQGVKYLDDHGYAVFSNVLSSDEANHSIDLLWKFLENLNEPYDIQRDDPETWDDLWPGSRHTGLLNALGIGQSEFVWFVRGNPNIKKVFSHIWDSNELFVSFDGAGCFRNWHRNPEWKTITGWYHCDQNPYKKPNRCSIQGLVSLTDSDETTGGLVLIPDSHKRFLELRKISKEERLWGNFVPVSAHYPLLRKTPPRLIKCKAGDFIVWDSRTIHCNTSALVDQNKTPQPELLRVVTYICMSPLSMFVPNPNEYKSLEEFRQLREQYVRDGITCTHWPLELIDASRGVRHADTPLKLNAYQHSLIIGTHIEPENGKEEMIF